jgi:diguanylate cyclase (GGDEF)-like protein
MHYSRNNGGQQVGRFRPILPNSMFSGKIPSNHHRKRPSEKDLEDVLTSALLAGDNELGQIVHEVDEISKVLKSGKPDATSIRVATHSAVWSAVKHALLDRELRYLALTDELTCLYNRRGFFAAAAQQLKLARRNSHDLLLLFCDLDNLKKINDRYGHREGDLALVRTADALEEAFRESDILARIGGDEFVVLALEVSSESQEVILRRLEKGLKESNAKESRYQLALSIGVARFDPKRPVSLGELMALADKAMYEQKRSRLQTGSSQA